MRVAEKSMKTKKCILEAPIPLERPEKKKLNKDKYVSFKLWNNPADADSTTYEFTVKFFQGTPEEVLDFVQDVNRVQVGQNLTQGPAKYALMHHLLKGDALAAFNTAATAAGNETNQNFPTVTNGLVAHVFPCRALATQKCCMCRFMWKPATMTMHEYMAHLTKIN